MIHKENPYFDEEQFMVTAEELRQYFFCPRKLFFWKVRKIPRSSTYLMQKGTDFHDNVIYKSTSSIEGKKILKEIIPPENKTQQYHDVSIESQQLHLMARLDLFEKNESEIYPVEIKTGPKPPQTHQIQHHIQLTAQALLLEEKFNCAVHRGRIIYIGSKESELIDITIDMKRKVLQAIDHIREILSTEDIPPPTKYEGNCTSCELFFICKRA